MDRGRKREEGDEQPEYKRACSLEFRPCTSASSSSPPPPPLPPPPLAQPLASTDCDMESTSSGRSDRAVDSGYGSCDSDGDSDQEHGDDGDDRLWRANAGTIQRVWGRLGEDSLEPSSQLAALTELCEWLSFCTEGAMVYFPLETVVPTLVRIAGQEINPDAMLLAIRALTYLCDSMPRYTDAIVRHGALPVLCGKLQAIEYLDVAEQCLQALEKISKKQEVACLKAGTISAVLVFIDFFSTSLQRVAVTTVANVCKKLTLDFSSTVMESVPALCNLLEYEDQKLVETVVSCLIRIVDCFNCSSELLDELCGHGIVQKSLKLITNNNHISLNQTTNAALVSLLRKLAASSLLAVKTLFELNVGRTLKDILMASEILHGTTCSSLGDARSNQVHEVFMLVNQLIPPGARDVEGLQLVLAKEQVLVDQPKFLHEFSIEFLPASIQVVNSGANSFVCYGCVSTLQNIVYFSTPDMLLKFFKNINISSFLAGLLARKNIHILISTMMTIEILMQKLPDAFLSSFIKEGVIYAVEVLSMREKCLDNSRCLCYVFPSKSTSQSEVKSCKVEKDTVHALANRIRTNYFTYEALNTENGLTEIVQKLRTFCMVLNDNVDRCSTSVGCLQNEEYLTHILDQIMKELYGGESMSTFEFIQSGIVKSLAHYLSNGKYLSETSSDCSLSNHFLTVLRRFQKFAQICISDLGKNDENLLLPLLVRKLQNALLSLDNFPVIQSQGFRLHNNYADIPLRCSTTNPCLKVHLVREKEEENLSDYNKIVNVDISSTLDAIERYLWLKGQGKNECKTKPGETHLAKAADSSLVSKYVLKSRPLDTHIEVMQQPAFRCPSEIIHGQRQASMESISDRFAVPSRLISTVDGTTNLDNLSANNIDSGPKLTFYLNGIQLDRSMTLYQAILQNLISTEPDMIIGPKFWNDVYQLTYKSSVEPELKMIQKICSDSDSTLQLDEFGFSWRKLPLFSSTLLSGLPCELDKSNPAYDILFMLKTLEGLNRFSFHLLSGERINAFAEGKIENLDDLKVAFSLVPQAEFVSNKLTDKLEQQMRDPLVLATASMPLWCSQLMAACPFLFPFESKWKYFHLMAVGPSVQHHRFQNSDGSSTISGSERQITSNNTLSRKKFKVNRGNIMESAAKMMEAYAKSKSILEVEYIDEVGTGLGPTMEFYTLVSHEFQSVGLGMWRGDLSMNSTTKMVGDSQYVMAPFGLFPRPWSSATSVSNGVEFANISRKFLLLGKLIARAIKDGRILDIPFSRAFLKLILEQELGIYDIQSFDPKLGRILLEFQAIINRRRFLQSTSGGSCKGSFDLHYRNTRIEDLCLDFTLPGYSDFVLKSGNNSNMVTIDNLEEYVALVVDATVKSGISMQVEAFKSGFNEVFPLVTLQIFTEDELERVLCGERDTWSFNELVDHIKFDHGYTASNPSVINLLEIVEEFGCSQRRAFLQFVTGAPRLPPGGLAALSPKLTVVRKHCNGDVDMDLPSVMTCANYLKLPPYSSKEKMRQRLLYAITEGQGSFHLS